MQESEYLSPLYVGGSLLPACLLWVCPECPNYEYHETEYRGERLYSYAEVSR